jgi:hypothetical protein
MILTAQNYYSKKANMEYFSVSQFKAFEKCQNAALAEIKGKYVREPSTAMLVGSFVDSYFEGTIDEFVKANPAVLKKDGTLRSEFLFAAQTIIPRIEKDKTFMKHLSGAKQVIMTGEICGVKVKIKIDSYREGKAIDDLKIMKDFEPVYVEEKGKLPWWSAWQYDLQGAVYQEVVRQNTGKRLPFYLAAATKETVTDIDIVHVHQDELDFSLEKFVADVETYDAIKKGVIKPDRCGKCDWCKISKVIRKPTESSDFIFM